MSWARDLTPANCNFVHNDEIWKDHVSREFKEHRNWPNKWGYLLDYYKKQLKPLQEESESQNKEDDKGSKNKKSKGKGPALPPIHKAKATDSAGTNKTDRRRSDDKKKFVSFPGISPTGHSGRKKERKSSDPTAEAPKPKVTLPHISSGRSDGRRDTDSFPQTSAGEVGWRWRGTEELLKYGTNRLGRRKKNIRRALDWPQSFM